MNDLFLKLYAALKPFLAASDGQGLTEYAMAVGLIAFGCVAGESAIAHSVSQTLVAVTTVITTGVAP